MESYQDAREFTYVDAISEINRLRDRNQELSTKLIGAGSFVANNVALQKRNDFLEQAFKEYDDKAAKKRAVQREIDNAERWRKAYVTSERELDALKDAIDKLPSTRAWADD